MGHCCQKQKLQLNMGWQRRSGWSHNKQMQQTDTKEIQKYARMVGKVIHWKWFKRLKFSNSDKSYAYREESVLKNETIKIFWDFELQTNTQMPLRRAGYVFINKRKMICQHVDFVVSEDQRVKIKERKKRQTLGSCQRAEKTWKWWW